MIKKIVALLMSFVLVLAACGSDDSGETTAPPEPATTAGTTVSTTTEPPPVAEGVSLAVSDVARVEPVGLGDPGVREVATGDLELGLALLRLAGEEGDNVFLSPYSVGTALGMLVAGARGETQEEIADAIGAEDLDAYHPGRNAIDAAIADPGFVPGEGDAEVFTLRGVNSLFGQSGFSIEQEYLDLLARYYGAGVQLVDFAGAPGPSRIVINDWVEDQTEDRIQDLIPEGVITTLTRVVLVNAVYFKANWLRQFDPANTTTGEFAAPTGTATADFMRGSQRAVYVSGDGYEAIRLPYMGNTTSMLVVVPDDLASFVADLDAAGIDAVRSSLSEHQVDLSMPKFEFTTALGLKPLLQRLGINAAFVEPSLPDGADLTGIHADPILFVHDALHKAFVAVDEEGTEAAAATAIVIGLESAPPPATMAIDQPFLFIIENDVTGEPIFIGQVTDPTEG